MDNHILALQKLLNERCNANLDEDGIYGPSTSKAVKKYLGDDIPSQNVTNLPEPKTEHFCLKEFYSNAMVGGMKVVKTIQPPDSLYQNIQSNMNRLEQLRSMLGGMPITITSGYRTLEYNQHVNGADNSAHLRGFAADIVVKGLSPREVYMAADKLYLDGGVGLYDTFVHVDVDSTLGKRRW